MALKIKICGITNSKDAVAAAEAGADILGFVFCETSPRHISYRTASGIIRDLPPTVLKAGVFVNAEPDFVARVAGECGLDLLQFHGEEPPDYCFQFGERSIKAFRMRDVESLRALPAYASGSWLLDAYTAESRGGTGVRFDWDLAIQAGRLGRPIFLAGGLTPENVAAAVQQVHPYGVDVSSGVEARPGRKDPTKLAAFIETARHAAPESTREPFCH